MISVSRCMAGNLLISNIPLQQSVYILMIITTNIWVSDTLGDTLLLRNRPVAARPSSETSSLRWISPRMCCEDVNFNFDIIPDQSLCVIRLAILGDQLNLPKNNEGLSACCCDNSSHREGTTCYTVSFVCPEWVISLTYQRIVNKSAQPLNSESIMPVILHIDDF